MDDLIEVGAKYLFHGRHIYLGEVVKVTLLEIGIHKSTWMFDTGIRFEELLSKGIVPETRIEVFEPEEIAVISRSSFVRFPWKHKLPTVSQP